MTDLHTHVLPNVDDGSRSAKQSIELIMSELENGVTDIVCTPHFRRGYNKSAEEITEAFNEFKNLVKDIPVNLYLGQEIFIAGNVKKLLEEKSVLTINGSKYILVEFDYFTPCDITDVVYELKTAGYIPVIAHIERYEYVTIETVFEIKQLGGIITVNADSIVGDGKKHYYKFIKKMFKYALVDAVASDVHHGRTNKMKEAYEFINKKFGLEAAEVVFNITPKRILKGQI